MSLSSRTLRKYVSSLGFFLLFFLLSHHTWAATIQKLPGNSLPLHWTLPFVGMLLSIALCPLLIPNFWHHHFGKITALWAVLILAPLFITFGWNTTSYEISHILLTDYVPFIILLFTLFTVSGGIRFHGDFHGTPLINTFILFIGSILASFMGTTGAAMLLIRPILHANQKRMHVKHIVIFFIFLVANIGGCLTPLGDPPLFVGFLNGVPFWWPLKHLILPFLVVLPILLVIFYVVDCYFYRKEKDLPPLPPKKMRDPISVDGKINILFLLAIIAVIVLSGFWENSPIFHLMGTPLPLADLTRDGLLLVISGLSLIFTTQENRQAHGFTWDPIIEVAKLFLGIFITITPVLSILKAGEHGALAPIIHLVSTPNGTPINEAYFWITGILSGFLDNAPTYMVFFNVAGGHAHYLTTYVNETLVAISAGSVFMGAMTYVGNAPNLMVKTIAEHRGVKMPSFFGYILWSTIFLIPVFFIMTLIFFT